MERRWLSTNPEKISYTSSQRHLVAALRNVIALINTAERALNTLLIQEGIYLSEKLGREVAAQKEKSASVCSSDRR